MKKIILGSLGLIVVVVIIFLVVFLGDKALDLESEQVELLYSYLGEVDINHCGGLNAYSGEEVTFDSIDIENKLCMAYYTIENQLEEITAEISTTNEYDIDICIIGEGIKLVSTTEEGCTYKSVDTDLLAEAYQKIYGQDITLEESFYISDTQACYQEGESYYCGEAETSQVVIAPESTVYRLMVSASEQLNGDIVITDYYLRVSNNSCYQSSTYDEELTDCSTLLEEGDVSIDIDFVQEYGTLYKHTFKQDSNGNYYWYSSKPKN